MLLIALYNFLDMSLSRLIGLPLIYIALIWVHINIPRKNFYEMAEPLMQLLRKISPKLRGLICPD